MCVERGWCIQLFKLFGFMGNMRGGNSMKAKVEDSAKIQFLSRVDFRTHETLLFFGVSGFEEERIDNSSSIIAGVS